MTPAIVVAVFLSVMGAYWTGWFMGAVAEMRRQERLRNELRQAAFLSGRPLHQPGDIYYVQDSKHITQPWIS